MKGQLEKLHTVEKERETVSGLMGQLQENLLLRLLTGACYEADVQRRMAELDMELEPENLILVQFCTEFENEDKQELFRKLLFEEKEIYHPFQQKAYNSAGECSEKSSNENKTGGNTKKSGRSLRRQRFLYASVFRFWTGISTQPGNAAFYGAL